MALERTMKSLLILVRNHKELMSGCGLCYLVGSMYRYDIITYDERRRIEVFLDKNRPDRGKYILWIPGVHSPYWWKRGVWTPRKWWLNAQIKKLS
jgi:hypothetical protein